MKVCLDAGHGGKDPGTSGNGIVEKIFAKQMCERIGHYLREDGVETIFSRPNDKKIAIGTRARIAVQGNADIFLSIHCNGVENDDAHGSEAFVVTDDHRSAALAAKILHRVANLKPRGVKWDSQSQHPTLGVLRGTYKHMPAILLELGFCTNEFDSHLMADKFQREEWARAIAEAIVG